MSNNRQFISWRRVSTGKQGKSGLGLQAQQDIISHFISIENGTHIADYCEVYTGTELSGCTQLRKAMDHCKELGATLIIAKSDRFRNTAEALKIYEEMGDGNIYFCDLPATDKFTLTLFFALAEREASLVSIRTKAALKAKKELAGKTGGTKDDWGKNLYQSDAERRQARTEGVRKANRASSERRVERAKANPNNIAFREFIELWEAKHGAIGWQADWISIAEELNRRGKRTATGLEFTPQRAQAMFNKIKKEGN